MARYNLLKKILITGACLCALVPVAVICADSSAVTTQNSTSSSSISEQNAKCRKSELTQEKFLEIIHTIAMHGDLSDIPFIEKTLGAKFSSPHDYLGGTVYDIDSYRGTPIKISILSYDTPKQKDWISKPAPKTLAMISFYGLDKAPSGFHDCGHLEKDKLDQKFAPNTINSFDGKGIRVTKGSYLTDPIDEVFARGILNDVVGKYGATTDIDYNFSKTTKAVAAFTIRQKAVAAFTIRQIVLRKLSGHQ